MTDLWGGNSTVGSHGVAFLRFASIRIFGGRSTRFFALMPFLHLSDTSWLSSCTFLQKNWFNLNVGTS